MLTAIPHWFVWLFWVLALLFSAFYGWKAFDAFDDRPPGKPWGWWAHQVWFNFAGAVVGWAAMWFIVRKLWHVLATDSPADFGWSDGVLSALAFVGITGHLPYATAGLLKGIRELARKLTGLGQ
jgi:hypothetical protein